MVGLGHRTKIIIKWTEEKIDHNAKQKIFQQSIGSGKALPKAVRSLANGAELFQINDDEEAAARLMISLEANPEIEYVEYDRFMHSTYVPNDPKFSNQWYLSYSKFPAAWDSSTGSGQHIAIIDSGITDHPDLDGNRRGGFDFVSDPLFAGDGDGRDNNPRDEGVPSSWQSAVFPYCNITRDRAGWHGTHVAGIAAATANNGVGIAGSAHGAKFVPIRVLSNGSGEMSDVIDAIVWASGGYVSGVPTNNYPSKIINLSLGANGPCPSSMNSAIRSARSRGSIVIAAAGNDSASGSSSFPSNCTGVVSVAASTSTGSIASFSNRGGAVDLAAPGESIYSTLNSGYAQLGSPSYRNYDGTSMAAPIVSAVAAMSNSIRERGTDETEALLKKASVANPLCSGCGAGIIDGSLAVKLAKELPDWTSIIYDKFCDSTTTVWATAQASQSPIAFVDNGSGYVPVNPPSASVEVSYDFADGVTGTKYVRVFRVKSVSGAESRLSISGKYGSCGFTPDTYSYE